ncbi:CHAT domain-containing protein [Streptomyces sp. NPDC059340]|uniref:CHAT domain-containing protein n=1 Tax=Streptomyces sp. NPDC059340 TaxID=3346806 RepID=UPI0036CB54BE
MRDYLEVWNAERPIRATPHSLATLYEGLIGPAEELPAEVQRLMIVPNGIPHAVPFAAQRCSDGYLTEQRTVVVAPSTAVAVRAGCRLSAKPNEVG